MSKWTKKNDFTQVLELSPHMDLSVTYYDYGVHGHYYVTHILDKKGRTLFDKSVHLPTTIRETYSKRKEALRGAEDFAMEVLGPAVETLRSSFK